MLTELETTQLEPYVGPVPFEAKDQALFFGRDSESDELMSLAIAHPVLLMYAQSGAGKTSLLNANFVPKLKKEGYEVLPIARVQGNDCDAGTNIYVFNTLMSWAEGKVDPRQLARMTLVDFLLTRVHQKNNVEWELPRFLIFDQFEELFTAYPQRWQERKEIFMQIRDALEKDYLLRVVFAMREDYIAELDAYAELLPEKLRTRFRLERPRAKAALAAVKKPLDVVKTRRHFADGVAEQLVQNLLMIPADAAGGESQLGQFVEPVQLQVVCQSLWKALQPQDDEITYEHLEHCGDVNRALSDFYERCLEGAVEKTTVKEGELRDWFGNTLITSDNTRGMVFRGAERTGGILNTAVDVLEKLHLIKEEKRGRSRWYELAHDRFIDPIRKSNDKWWGVRAGAVETRQRLEARAKEWVRHGRGSEGLLDQAELLEADRWLNGTDAAYLPPTETLLALISASRAAIKEAADAAEIAQAQTLVIEQQRRFSQLRLGLVVVGVLLITMTGLTVFAFQQRAVATRLRIEADAQRAEANVQRDAAIASGKQAKEQEKRAEGEKIEADKQRAEATRLGGEAIKEAAAAKKAEAEAKRAEGEARRAELAAKRAETDALAQKTIVEADDLSTNANFQLKTNPELSVVLAREALVRTRDVNAPATRAAAERSLHASLEALRKVSSLSLGPDRIKDAVISPDGKRIAIQNSIQLSGIQSPSRTKYLSIRIFDIVSGKFLATLPADENPVFPVSFSPDGKTLAFASGDGAMLLWNTETGKVIDRTFSPRERRTYPTRLALNANKLLVCESDVNSGPNTNCGDQIFLWDFSPRKFGPSLDLVEELKKAQIEPSEITSLAINPSGNLVALGQGDGSIILWDIVKKKPIIEPKGLRSDPAATVALIAFGSDRELVIARADGKVTGWNLATDEEYSWGTQTPEEVPLLFSPGLRYLATKSSDSSDFAARVVRRLNFDLEGNPSPPLEQFNLAGHKSSVIAAAFASDARSLVTVSSDKTANVWDLSISHELRTYYGPWSEVAGIKFTPDGSRLIGAIADASHPTAEVWTENEQEPVLSLRGENSLDTRTRNKCRAGSPDLDKCGHKGKVWAVDFNEKRNLIATGGSDSTVKIWDPVSGKVLQTLRGHTRTVREVSFTTDGNQLATSSDDGTAKIWDLSSGKLLRTLFVKKSRDEAVYSADTSYTTIYEGDVPGIAFSPDGKYVATASSDGTATVWNVSSGEAKFVLEGHTDVVWKVTFSPDGRRIATASHDGTAKVWDAATGRELLTLTGHTGALWGVSFSKDGTRIATASLDKTARIWDANTGRELLVLTGHRKAVNRAVFSPDGRRLATSSEDGTVRLYTLDEEELIALSRQRVPRALTPEEREKYLPER